MPLRYDEWVPVLKAAGLSYQEIADRMSRSERYVRAVKGGQREPKYPALWEREIGQIAAEVIALPWSLEAQEQIIAIMNLLRTKQFAEIDRLFGFSSQIMLEQVRAHEPMDAISPSPVLWGQTLSVFYVLFALRRANSSGLPDKFSEGDWLKVVGVLLALLETEAEATWAVILRYKVEQLRLAAKWNALDPKGDDRRSDEMRQWLTETDMRNRLLAYNDLIPHVLEAPFAAMAIASRFSDRDSYPDILARLQAIDDRYKTVEGIESLSADKDFNEDFEDFFAWAKANRRLIEKEVAKCTIR
ncbi:MAG: hypothetical protein HWD86_09170 [Kangiellaceae bacterium]|nr:hypothetical protein [Kangiellaceae bacterium]